MAMVLIILVFIIGYAAIAFEHVIHLNKAASALITGVLCWTIYFVTCLNPALAESQLMEALSEISAILFFLLGAMTIVELIDSHRGFDILRNKIRTNSYATLLSIVAIVTFFLSALLDNLTTSIIMMSLVSKLVTVKTDRLWFAGLIIIAANAGGAWSPLGDVTTTMLWLGGQLTPLKTIAALFIPSLAVCLIPLLIMMFRFRNKNINEIRSYEKHTNKEGLIILVVGLTMLVLIPLFKNYTHMPPFMGMLLALGIMWAVVSMLHAKKDQEDKQRYSVTHALQKIDTPGILFFLGILLAVSALESINLLENFATVLTDVLQNNYVIGIGLGLLSAVVDNVPLVAATQSMFHFTTDHYMWHFLALTTGTGGSIIIIGSAAGIAVMGMEEIDFIWYIKKIGWLAFLGFTAGISTFIIQQSIQASGF